MTIYEIKRRSQAKKPHYFSRNTMKFFEQTLKDFRVYKLKNDMYQFRAKRPYGETIAYFDAITNDIGSNLETLIKQRENNGTK